jgi:peroxiredoxin Q/BCP
MSRAQVNRKVPAFTAESTGEQTFKLADAKGKNLVIYFYPKDSTPGCTREGQDFRDNHAKFKRNKTLVVGVSRDSIASHEKFKAKQGFPFELLSDKDESLCKLFDVIKEKNMYGKKVMGIERSTFLIDASGKLRHEWRKVKVDGHVEEVLEAVRELNKA